MKGQEKKRSTWSWVFEFAGIRRKDYIASVVLAVCKVLCIVAPYLVMAQVVSELFAGVKDFSLYGRQFALIAALWMAAAVFHALSTSASHKATFYVLGAMRKRACDKLARMPLGDVTGRSSGGLKNVLVERIDSIETTLAHVIPEFTSNLLAPILIFACMLALDWRLALVSLATLPLGLVCMAGMFKDYDVNNQRAVDATKALNDTAVEYIHGIEVIKVFGKTQSSYAKFVDAAKAAAETYVSWMSRCNVYFSLAMSVMPATLLAVLPVGAFFVSNGSLAPETFIMCIVLSLGLITPVITILSYSDDLAALDVVMGEVTSIIDAPEQVRPAQTQATVADNTVTLEDVRFGYKDEEVLHGISFTAREGETTALVGPSGSGKSTVARLIDGLWDVQGGTVRLGGADIRDISSEDYNRRVSFVSQNSYLFNDTVRENIRMGRPGATDQDVENIARAAGCHEFICSLENGYDTVVGSGGERLSGGERQRISIARAMLKDAPVVILDEATAYTDPENEAVIEQSVARLVQGKTLIVIAHRLSTIQGAQHIVVIDGGRVAEEGTHDQLLAENGLYARMWEAHTSVKDHLTEGGDAA
ncbi:ABC transporter ATP-binding protein [Slackia heliotrinireducens]|uniref:ABC transporter ATP-binding protein n=1 Tax=Slackia heliotrinireducens TaxID=84110 RepID=UPI003315B6F8